MSVTKLPDWLRIEMKVLEICQRIEETGWLVNREEILQHIETLKLMKTSLEDVILPQIPLIPTALEAWSEKDEEDNILEYKYVKKPFLKSGKWNKHVEEYWDDREQSIPNGKDYDTNRSRIKETGEIIKWSIGGPYTRVAFEQIKLTSDQQVKKYLLSVGWQPIEWNISKQGKNKGKVTSPKITEESLDSIDNNVGRLIAQYLKACHRQSQLEGWLNHIRPDGRLPMVIDPQGTPTGRATHKNIVNVPSVDKAPFFAKEMRSVFIAKPGYVLVGCDSMSDQIRKLCHYMGDEEFTYAVVHGKKEDGTDMHSLNMRRGNLPSRGHAKNFFYGAIMFGAGDLKTGKLLQIKGSDEVKKKAGRAAKETYWKGLPKYKELLDGLQHSYKQRGYILALDGRPLFPRKDNDCMAYLIQGAEAVMMKLALCYIDYWVQAEGLDAKLVGWVHDEYTLEVRKDQAERVRWLAEEAIRQAGRDYNLLVPSDGEGKIGNNWYEIH